MKSRALSVAVGAVILVVLLLYLFSFKVRETETVVLTTFGKPAQAIEVAGLRFKWPWPIQSVRRFDRRLNLFDTTLGEVLTSDRQPIVVSLAVGWRIKDPLKFLQYAGSEPNGERFLRQLVDHQTSVVGQYKLENFVSTDPKLIKFEEIETELMAPVNLAAGNEYGVEVPLLRIRRLELPQIPSDAVYDRMRAERQKEANRYRSEGQGLGNEIAARAKSERMALRAKATADADRIMAEGDAEAAKYYVAFEKNPELAIFLRQIKALRKILAERSTIVLDVRTMPFNLLAGGGVKIPVAAKPGAAANVQVPAKDEKMAPASTQTPAKVGG